MLNNSLLIIFKFNSYYTAYVNYTLIIFFISIIFLTLAYLLSTLKKPTLLKRTEGFETYEFGATSIGNSSFILINKHFYILGILFIIFDIELMFLFPWVYCFNEQTFNEKFIMLTFIIILMLGFIYEVGSGALNWYTTPVYNLKGTFGFDLKFLFYFIKKRLLYFIDIVVIISYLIFLSYIILR